MAAFDEATQAYMRRLLEDAPPLPADVAVLVVRTFANQPNDTSSPVSDAA